MEKVEIEIYPLANTKRVNVTISNIPVEESVGIFGHSNVKERNSNT